jgi:transcriptional regulator with XRE-family HTH domain
MENLESYRKKMGVSQKTMAIALDIHQSNLCSVENGKRQLTPKQKAILDELIKNIPDNSDTALLKDKEFIVIDPKLKKELPFLKNKLEKEQLTFEKLTDKLENVKKEWLLFYNANSKSTNSDLPEIEIKYRNATTKYRKITMRHQNLWLKIEILKTKVRCATQITNQLPLPVALPSTNE